MRDGQLDDIIPALARETPFEKWDEIRKAKADFLKTGSTKFLTNIPDIVAYSWQNSYDAGVGNTTTPTPANTDVAEYYNAIEENKIIIDLAEKLLLAPGALRLQGYTGYYITITDKNGMMIFASGGEKSKKYFESVNIKPGTKLSESIMGTNAYSMAMNHGKPAQLIGPYNYKDIFDKCIITAIPIFHNNEVIGVYGVMQYDVEEGNLPFTAHIFGMAASMTNLIASHMILEEERNKLNLMKSFTNIMLPSINHENKGIITIDSTENIIYINTIAALWLKYNENCPHLSNYIGNYDKFKKLLNRSDKQQNIKTDITNCTSHDIEFMATLHPVKNSIKNKTIGTMIYLNSYKPSEPNMLAGIKYSFDSIIGNSQAIKNVKNLAKNIASTKNNVLILGESGTGKEMFAQAIHNSSDMSGPFVAINCAAIPPNLIATELFGYVGGAFTDAQKAGRQGKIEFANNGTLFLDEIGDMPIDLQPVLLRVLEEKRITRIGGKESIPVNFRIISATNADLYNKVLKKEFREDLYFRLAVISLEIPPLRERNEDVLLLAEYFIQKTCQANAKEGVTLSENVKAALMSYHWHGNIRQLESTMVSAVFSVHDGEQIEIVNLPKIIREAVFMKYANQESLEDTVISRIHKTLETTGGNILAASKKLGISRSTIYRKLRERQ